MEDEAMVITKVKNIYIMLLNAISHNNIDRVDHYLDDKLAQDYRKIINYNMQNNLTQKFDQLNITNVEIVRNDSNYLFVTALVRYADYTINNSSHKIVSGNNLTRSSKNLLLKFKKQNVVQQLNYQCPGCGASLNLNNKGICDQCGKVIDEQFSPLILFSIE